MGFESRAAAEAALMAMNKGVHGGVAAGGLLRTTTRPTLNRRGSARLYL